MREGEHTVRSVLRRVLEAYHTSDSVPAAYRTDHEVVAIFLSEAEAATVSDWLTCPDTDKT